MLAVVEAERSGGRLGGVIVQFGGQTPLKLAAGLAEAGVPLLGTSVEAIDLAEDRGRFGALLARLGYKAPPYATARSVEQALRCAGEVGFPLLVRPSYVLGGRAMEIVYSHEDLSDYLSREAGEDGESGEIYLDRFLEDSLEVDVDALCDGTDVWIGGIMQHVEEAGVHSGDSACVLPPHSLGEEMLDQIRGATRAIALEIGVVGLINVQYAIHAGELYVIEANPRASRTVPFVSKAVGVPLAKLACRVMLGEPLAAMGLPQERQGLGYGDHISVKEAVLPFDRFENSDAVLGPEMRSTGEVMGVARDFPTAFAKAQAAAGVPLPSSGTAFITVTDEDKAGGVGIAQSLHDAGFRIVATRGTAEAISRMGVPVERLNKIGEGSPHVVDWIERGDVDLVINTPTGVGARTDGHEIRRAAVTHGVPCLTTLSAGMSAARAISRGRIDGEPEVHLPAGPARDRTRRERRRGQRGGRRRGRPRDPWPAGRRRSRAGGERRGRRRRPPRRGRRRGVSLPPAAQAPLGRRLGAITAVRELGVYRVITVADPGGPAPAPGQFAMLAAAERWGGGEDERPFLARAFSVARHGEGHAQFLLEDVGPGTRRLCELGVGEQLWLAGPLRTALHRAGGGPAGDPRRRRRRDRAAGDPAGCARGRRHRDRRAAGLPRRRPRGGRRAAARRADRERRRLGRPPRARHGAARARAGGGRRGERLRVRPGGDARGRAEPVRARRRSRAARAGVRHGLRLRRLLRLRRPDPRRALPARVRRGPRDRRRPAWRASRRTRAPASVRSSKSCAPRATRARA